jgi:hypothetical protein
MVFCSAPFSLPRIDLPLGGPLSLSSLRKAIRWCCLCAALLAASHVPARAQSLHADFAAAEFADLESSRPDVALTNFQRYTLIPCASVVAHAQVTIATPPPANCAVQKPASAPRYHLETGLDFSVATPAASLTAPQDSSSEPAADDEGAYSSSFTIGASSTPGIFSAVPSPASPSYFDALAYQDRTIPHAESFHWWPALEQSFYFLLIEHGFRIADDPFLRYLLWHKPFWHDYIASTRHFNMNQWGDGDDFIVNYVGHPMEGGVTGYIQIQNDPRGRSLVFGMNRDYWTSRLKAMAWAAVYSAQFEIGPILSEAAIGNEGGYYYRPGCDPYLTCSRPDGRKPITNNTGWVDFVVTPTVGMGWIVLEDVIEKEVTDRWAPGQPDDPLKWKIVRGALSPTHVMSNFVAGKVPWYRYRIYGPDDGNLFPSHNHRADDPYDWTGIQRWEIGAHYSYLSLPVGTETCYSCRVSNSGFGVNFAYRITNRLWVDSDVNVFPSGGGYASKGTMVQGEFGPRYGYTGKNWGLYVKLRPGFIYYDKTLTLDSGAAFVEATRFAWDFGSIFEWFATRHSTLRVDAGTTVVRYLTSHTDPRQPPGDILSNDYYVSQSNFQLTTGYTYRF